VGPWRERPRIREIEILGDEQASFGLSGSPNVGVVFSPKSFVEHRIGVQPEQGEARGHGRSDILVELDPQATLTSGGTGLGAGRSSAADAAASAITARTSSSLSEGKSLSMVPIVSP
jgi:hypothetical protein